MFELVLGIFLSAIFVTAYWFITKLLGRDTRELGDRRPETVTLNPMDTARHLGSGRPPRALTSGGGKRSDGPRDDQR
jgi:hypothetical protein